MRSAETANPGSREGVIRSVWLTDAPPVASDIEEVLAATKAQGVSMSSDPHDELAPRRNGRSDVSRRLFDELTRMTGCAWPEAQPRVVLTGWDRRCDANT